MTRPLRLLAPDTVDVGELDALLDRVRAAAPGLTVGTEDRPGAVTVPLVLDGAARSAPGPDTARPLGPHPGLVAAAAQRVDAALAGADPATAFVLLVGRGSTEPEDNAEVAKGARLLQEGRDLAGVEHAYLAGAEPGVAAGLQRCRLLGATHVVVLPHALMDPAFRDGVQAVAVAPDGVRVVVAEELGDSAELADLVLERYHEVVHGDLRSGCDVCAHRELAVHRG